MENYKDLIEEISKKRRFDIKLNLDRIKSFLNTIENPQDKFKSIHVGGTNGKGSTCTFIYSTLIQAGYKTGLFQSPYIKEFNESIQINNKKITNDEVIEYYSLIKKSNIEMTYFEIKTAMAFMHFKRNNVDYAIIEVGLGGRFDATNVLKPVVSIITNISLEHTKYLGNSIEEIAYEKAGIIKKHTPLFTMVKNNALKVINKVAEEKKSKMILVKYNPKLKFEIRLKGIFQQKNAQLSYHVLKFLNIEDEIIKKGFNNAFIRGRFELKNNVIYDCAHNEDAIKTLCNELKNINLKIIVIISIMDDKNKIKMIKLLEKYTDFFIFTKVDNERSINPKELCRFTKKSYLIIEKSSEALKYAKINFRDKLILVTGSCYLIGEVLTN